MTSTPYQPSSPGPRDPGRTTPVPQARSTSCPSPSTWSSSRASACHSRSLSSQRTRHCDSLSAPPVGCPLAPAPPTPPPAAAAAAGPSRAPPAARCQRTRRQNPPPRRGTRLLEPSPPWPSPIAATTLGSSASAAGPLPRPRSPGAPNSSPGSSDSLGARQLIPTIAMAERRRSLRLAKSLSDA